MNTRMAAEQRIADAAAENWATRSATSSRLHAPPPVAHGQQLVDIAVRLRAHFEARDIDDGLQLRRHSIFLKLRERLSRRFVAAKSLAEARKRVEHVSGDETGPIAAAPIATLAYTNETPSTRGVSAK